MLTPDLGKVATGPNTGGRLISSIPSFSECRGKSGYIAGWDITEPAIIEIGIDTLLKDLNFEVRPILANIPQLSDDQKKILLTNLDKNIN